MPFGLRNANATYQRCMQKCLHDQIGKNVQVHVDDVVIKTKESQTLIDDLREAFANLRRFRMKLNPTKCTFGVPASKLLAFLLSSWGYRGKSRQNPCYRENAATARPQGCTEVHWMPGILESLRKSAG
jgi:hypothetical protein